jgi:hypothetical protein
MDTRTVAILQADPELDGLARKFYAPFRRRLFDIEKEIDGLRVELSSARTDLRLEREARSRDNISASHNLQTEKESRAQDVEWYISKLATLEEDRTLLEEQIAEITPRTKDHWHDPDEPRPVLTFDFDGTLKPQIAKGDGGNYPLTDKWSDPFPDVKKWLDRWKSRGACLHLATAGLYLDGSNDFEVYQARVSMLQSWQRRYGLPIDLILPKVPVDVYYDDRMIEIPGDPSMIDGPGPAPDWNEIGELAEKEMDRRFFLDEASLWTRKDKKRIGEEIEAWPDSKLFRDHPRGYSGGRLDVDMHRTLSSASSSMRVAPPRDQAVETVRDFYRDGVTITVSCAGWHRQTHTLVDSTRRLAGIRQWLQQWSVPYDRVAEKDHADLYFDDKGVRFTGWRADVPKIKAKLPNTIAYSEH